jgi:PAS domain S-box-containing protein
MILSLSLLLAATSSWAIFLSYKVRSLKKENERLRREGKEDSKVLFLNSRYASMGETVGNIAHQWKQPLNAIGAIQNSIKASLLFQGDISKDKLLYSVETSFKLLQHLAETIDTFYSFLSQQSNVTMSFNVADELEKVRKITEYSFENSHITLNYELEINPTIQGNANEFTHAMLNLILNAKDAFDTSSINLPTITVRVIGEENNSIITVSDNAGGIRLDPVDMVFDMHITTKESGSGLGLFMTKKIIEQRFGGTITVENRHDGAYFTIELPYSEYGEHFSDILPHDKKLSLERINQLTHKIIELEEVEKTLQKWADIFKKAHWGIAMHVGTSNQFELTNEAFNSLYGYTSQELKDISVPDLFPPESLSLLPEVQQRAFEKGFAAFETINKRRDGSTFPVSVELIVVKDDDGKILYHIANIWDLSEKKAAEERLILKEFALNRINEAVYLIDKNSMFHYVNEGACTALGYTKEELLTMGVPDLDPSFPMEQWKHHWEDIKKKKTTLTVTQHQRKDRTIFPIEISSNYFEYNGVGYSLAVSRDITERLQLEQQKDNERMKLFFERQLVGMAITSPEYGWIHTNEKLQEMLGYTHEELTRLTWVEMTYPDDLAPDLEKFTKLMNAEIEDYMLEKRFIRKDGTIIYTNLAVSCVRNNDRSVNYVLVLLEDITERKSLEVLLQDAHDRYIQILDNSIDVIYLIEVTPEGHFVYVDVNAAYEEVTGIPREVVIGLDIEDIEDETFRTILIDKFTTALNAGEKTNYTADYPFPAGIRTFHSILLPIRNESGQIVRIVGSARDITDQKELEAQLQKERKFLIDAQRVAHTGSWHLDIQNSVLTWSDETYRIFELEKNDSEDLHKIFYEMVHPDDREMVSLPYAETLKTRLPYELEHRIVMADGRIKYVVERCEHVYNDDGIPLYSIGTVQDITARKKSEDALQSNRNLLHAILESSPGIVTFALDKEYRYIAFDSKHADVMRTIFDIEIAIGMNMLEAVSSVEDREIAKRCFDRALSGESFIAEEEYGDERLSRNYWQIFYSPIRAETGEVIGLTCFNMDITQRREKEETIRELNETLEKRVIERTSQLQKSQETFRAIVENSPDVISRYDLQMRRTYINPLMQYLLDKPLDEVLGKTPREFSPLPDVDVFEHLFNTVVQGKSELEYEGAFITPWGEKRWGNQRIIPEFDEDRNVISVMVIGRDMTERVEAEKRLKMIEMAVNSSAEAVYINNKELSIIYVNDEACRMLGYSRDELLSMKILEIDAKYTLQEIDEIIETKIREGKVIFETQHRKKDGSVIDVEVAGSFFIHEEDTILISLVKEIS